MALLIMALLIMALLIMALLIMAIHITLYACDIAYYDNTYNIDKGNITYLFLSTVISEVIYK
jgi:hypothetical protein